MQVKEWELTPDCPQCRHVEQMFAEQAATIDLLVTVVSRANDIFAGLESNQEIRDWGEQAAVALYSASTLK